jgi:cytochrome c551/c552
MFELFSTQIILIASGAVCLFLVLVGYLAGSSYAKRKIEKIKSEQRISLALNIYLQNVIEGKPAGLDGLLQAGVLTLKDDEEVRELIKRIVIHGEKNPFGKEREHLKDFDLYFFFLLADSENIDFKEISPEKFFENFRNILRPKKKKKNTARKIIAFLFVLILIELVVLQFVPVERSNPPVVEDIPAPAEVKAILKRACYDCHSHETVWPWYSRVAPASLLVSNDVREGRGHLDFSTWNRYTPDKQKKLFKKIWEEIQESEMPPWYYIPMHWDAYLSSEDKRTLRNWLFGEEKKQSNENAPAKDAKQ